MTMLMCCLLLACCGNNGSVPTDLRPAMNMTIASFTSTSVTLDVKMVNATHIRLLCVETKDASSQTVESVVRNGIKHAETKIEIGGLSPLTAYTVLAVACSDSGKTGLLQRVGLTTSDSESDMYAWEKARSGLLTFTDMVLCYGGSRHRPVYLWDKQRFETYVTYVDEQNMEHWLFDCFLCLEFLIAPSAAGGQYVYSIGKGTAAGKQQWEEKIEYWFRNGNGLNALEEAVKEATQRLGAPAEKRKVVMSMPDPLIYREWNVLDSPTKYWGELNGRELDFSKAEDRVTAYKWYVNQVRKRFDEKNFQHIELAGFYILSEEIVTPGDGWSYELKKSEEIVPPISEYLHSINQSLNWIPYNRAAGYKTWKQSGVDYAYMQPNYYFERDRSLSRFFSDIKLHNLNMEMEMDWEMLVGAKLREDDPNTNDDYRARFREYMAGAKTHGVYGTKRLAYYIGNNVVYDLKVSPHDEDKKMYHEFCTFVINNPLRNK